MMHHHHKKVYDTRENVDCVRRTQTSIIDVTHFEGRQLQPQDKDGLEREIPGEVVEDDAEGKALEEVEEAKNDPVGKPLDVVLGAGRLDGLEREVRGETPADEIGDEGGEGVDEVEDDEKRGSTNDRVGLGHLRALL